MNIILIGPQGSGKGTQARILCNKFNFFYFESGAYLRRIAESHPELKKTLSQGLLVPDKEMTSYLEAFLDSKNLYDDIIFDGFPRSVEQYMFLKNWLSDKKVRLDLVIDLQISAKETIRRLSARRLDPTTGEIYNLITDPPPPDIDTKRLIHRDDDKPGAIKKRLSLYNKRTIPLIKLFKKELEVFVVDGERSIVQISDDIESIVLKKIQK